MSRIGKQPIQIPSGVTITVDSDVITVVGSKGQLTVPHLSDVTVAVEEGVATVTRKDDERIAKAQHGLQRALLANAVEGVTKGFEKKLEVNGVGELEKHLACCFAADVASQGVKIAIALNGHRLSSSMKYFFHASGLRLFARRSVGKSIPVP